MIRSIDISSAEVQKHLAIARTLRAQAWSGWIYTAVKAAARVARVAIALAIETVEATRRAQRQRATVGALSALSDHILKDIGLTRESIYLVASEVSASSRPTRPGRVVMRAESRDGRQASLTA